MERAPERRASLLGLRIITARTEPLARRLADAGIPAGFGAMQDGPHHHATLPAFRSPIVLDTVQLPVHELVDALAHLDQLAQRPEGAPWQQRQSARDLAASPSDTLQANPLRVVALVDSADHCAASLVRLCPAIVVALADTEDISSLRIWMRHLAHMLPAADGQMPCAWIGLVRPPALPGNYLLRILPWLRTAQSIDEIARNCHIGRMTVSRTLQAVRSSLNLPSGDAARYAPAEMYTLIMEALATQPRTTLDLAVPSRSLQPIE